MARPAGVVHGDPDIVGVIPVFVGARVPFTSLFDDFEGGDTPDEFPAHDP